MRIAVIGTGRMGQAVIRESIARGHTIAAQIGRRDVAAAGGISYEALGNAEVAIEFTTPESAVGNLLALIELGVPVVTGTTGWQQQMARIDSAVAARSDRGAAVLHAANFSVGMALLRRAAAVMAELMKEHPQFREGIVEEHHAAKLDSPSGTALTIQRLLQKIDPSRQYPITAIRAGYHPGRHQMFWDSEFETVHIEHSVRDRRVFAVGAITAAEWLIGRQGVFTFADMLFGR